MCCTMSDVVNRCCAIRGMVNRCCCGARVVNDGAHPGVQTEHNSERLGAGSMDSNYKAYDHDASFGRLDSILDQSDLSYEEVNSLPDRDKLTFSNGFYANCSALFVDIRGSSRPA